ncbi:uncharacterized protein LOC115621376 [Scaptodrosophila lebanonensis]|uniref:Uncharacterized protein LOC115621376 n=1 Tax=Drosophila lebanonensis TaxID=7225 RepID=A0A6J2T7F6_DROLE|nr:uncharacterized protein LOC115621376 [Scaptodrosophila lebanonensis]
MANPQLTREKLDALRSEYKPRRSLLKYPRPKTKPEYQFIYPWLLPDETDPHFVFCILCECRLSAKRSDLGKHEGSIKHSENAQRKALPPKEVESTIEPDAVVKWEYTDDEDGPLPTKSDDRLDDVEDEEEEDDGENDAEAEYEPHCKRRVSETDSQNSGGLDYLPLQVTINESPNAQSLQPVQLLSQYAPPTSLAPAGAAAANNPCRITIKKVMSMPVPKMGPTATTMPTSSKPAQSQEITSKATITPIAAGNYAPIQRAVPPSQQIHQSHTQDHPQQLYSPYQPLSQNSIGAVGRDSFDLFFDSICATVKALPPKLATEGKIRVMQLIGELELRAINEREAQPAQLSGNTIPTATAGIPTATAADVAGSVNASQQNATVASTTK